MRLARNLRTSKVAMFCNLSEQMGQSERMGQASLPPSRPDSFVVFKILRVPGRAESRGKN